MYLCKQICLLVSIYSLVSQLELSLDSDICGFQLCRTRVFAITSQFSIILVCAPETDKANSIWFFPKSWDIKLSNIAAWVSKKAILTTISVEVRKEKRGLESKAEVSVCRSNFGQPFLPPTSMCLSPSLFFLPAHRDMLACAYVCACIFTQTQTWMYVWTECVTTAACHWTIIIFTESHWKDCKLSTA